MNRQTLNIKDRIQGTMYTVRGQSLVEILVALAIGVILIGSAAVAIVAVLRLNSQNKAHQAASVLAQETLDNVRIMSEADWRNIYNLSLKGTSTFYRVAASGTALKIEAGTATSSADNITFARYFTAENVSRDSCGVGDVSALATTTCGGSWPAPVGEIAEDLSTQKITAYAEWTSGGQTRSVSIVEYLTRWRNYSLRQTDWSGGGGVVGPTTSALIGYDTASCVKTGAAGSLTLGSSCGSSGSLVSTIYDTTSFTPASSTLNSLFWLGNYDTGTVKFQLASSNSSGGPWNYYGPDGSAASYYQPTNQNIAWKINPRYHSNYRYFRYKVFIDSASTSSPRVDDVVINWSP